MAIVTLSGQSNAALGGQTALFLRMQALLQLAGAPDTLVDAQLLLTLKDFYTFTTGWRKVLGPYSVNQNQDTVYLNPVDQNSQLQFVHRAWLYPFMSGNARQFLAPAARKVVGNDKNPPSSFFMQAPDELVLYPVPDKAYGKVLYCEASLIPTTSAAQLPNVTFTHHVDAILNGLYARMYKMPQKSWTDKALAADYAKEYRKGRLVWRNFAERNYGPRDVPTLFPPFAGRGSQNLTKAVSG